MSNLYRSILWGDIRNFSSQHREMTKRRKVINERGDKNATGNGKSSKVYPERSRNISLVSKSIKHPLNVKPSGNRYISTHIDGLSKAEQMGHLSSYSDDLIMMLLGYLDKDTLKNISHTSRIMYAYAYDEDLWKRLYMNDQSGEKSWNGSWRSTVLEIKVEADLQLPDNLLCSDVLYRPFQCSQIDYPKLFSKLISEEEVYHNDAMSNNLGELPPGRIPRIQEDEMTLDDFNTNHHDSPFIFVNPNDRWPNWDLQVLLERFPEVKFRQEAVQWKLSTYSKYLENNTDESPLYLFDCTSEAMKVLREEYQPPAIFQDDLFNVFNYKGSNCRPDHAWLIVGSERSGSTFHKDPNYTSAWNTALAGRKVWIMLPPGIAPPGVGTDDEESEVTSPVGIAEWVLSGFYNDAVKIPECLIGITFPGECMYVPSGWWHSVINLDDSVALTQNFVPTSKLSNALNFFKNRKDQISGFRPDKVKSMLDVLKPKGDTDNTGFSVSIEISSSGYSNIDDFSKEEEQILLEYRAKLIELDLGNEDCAEIKELPPLPMFELFKHLMIRQGKEQELEEALEKLARIERKTSGRNEKWEELATPATFSFAFDEDSE